MKDLIEAFEQIIAQTAPGACPQLVGELERLKALAWMRVSQAATQTSRSDESCNLLTITQVADRLNVPKTYAYELVRQGRLKGKKVGKYVRVSVDALAEYQAK